MKLVQLVETWSVVFKENNPEHQTIHDTIYKLVYEHMSGSSSFLVVPELGVEESQANKLAFRFHFFTPDSMVPRMYKAIVTPNPINGFEVVVFGHDVNNFKKKIYKLVDKSLNKEIKD